MSSSLKGLTVLASFAVQPVTRETESERYFENHYIFNIRICYLKKDIDDPDDFKIWERVIRKILPM